MLKGWKKSQFRTFLTRFSHSGSVSLPSGEDTPEYFGKVISNLDFK